jgi:hypothetical protein
MVSGSFLLCLLCRVVLGNVSGFAEILPFALLTPIVRVNAYLSGAVTESGSRLNGSAGTGVCGIRALYMLERSHDSIEEALNRTVMAGFNVILLSFFTSAGPTGACAAWALLSAQAQSKAIASAHAHGAIVMAAVGGSTETPYNLNASVYGGSAAAWAMRAQLDGIDFDL